jgi:hypothetical protein
MKNGARLTFDGDIPSSSAIRVMPPPLSVSHEPDLTLLFRQTFERDPWQHHL